MKQTQNTWFGDLRSRRDDTTILSSIVTIKGGSYGDSTRELSAIVDSDLSREDHLYRQYQDIGAVLPFSSRREVLEPRFSDNTYTRDTVCDTNFNSALKEKNLTCPNSRAINHLNEITLPSLVAQLRDCLILCHDVVDLSQTLHSAGLPIWSVRNLLLHIRFTRHWMLSHRSLLCWTYRYACNLQILLDTTSSMEVDLGVMVQFLLLLLFQVLIYLTGSSTHPTFTPTPYFCWYSCTESNSLVYRSCSSGISPRSLRWPRNVKE